MKFREMSLDRFVLEYPMFYPFLSRFLNDRNYIIRFDDNLSTVEIGYPSDIDWQLK